MKKRRQPNVFHIRSQCTVGPGAAAGQNFLCVEMGPDRGCVTHISADGKSKRIIAKIGRPNGMAVDKEGNIWEAESTKPVPCLIRMTIVGEAEVFLTECNGEKFLFPNDLVFDLDGALYLTDSGIKFEDFAPGGKLY